MQVIQSVSNPKVKNWKKLNTKKGRKTQEKYLLDGWHLVKEALKANVEVLEIMFTPDYQEYEELYQLQNVELYEITEQIAKNLSATPSPQGIFATIKTTPATTQIPTELTGAWLLLDGVQDPGNIGTMVRTADVAGFTGVVFGTGSADIYQAKVLRSMQGSHFHLEVRSGELTPWIAQFKKQGDPVYGSELNPEAVSYQAVPQTEQFALIMGNEGNGMQAQHLAETTKNLYIPIQGEAESLNVAVAAGILMFTLKK